YLLKLGVKIYSYNDHCSAPFSRACWLALAPPTLLGRGSRHCHGINCTHNGSMSEIACLRQLTNHAEETTFTRPSVLYLHSAKNDYPKNVRPRVRDHPRPQTPSPESK